MREILLFGGTAEGRDLAEWLLARGIPCTVCVATPYGQTLLPAGVDARVGRMDEEEMARLMASRPYACVVDATHPYAVEVTGNIQAAAQAAGLTRYRLVRDGEEAEGDWLTARDMGEAAALAGKLAGNILLTTGSKELDAFVPLAGRCYPRVLPALDSLRRCLELGFPPKNILCMQGPFTRQLDLALIRQYHIQILISKATGGAGGFWEKAAAAREGGCTFIVVARPSHEAGFTLAQLKERLEGLI